MPLPWSARSSVTMIEAGASNCLKPRMLRRVRMTSSKAMPGSGSVLTRLCEGGVAGRASRAAPSSIARMKSSLRIVENRRCAAPYGFFSVEEFVAYRGMGYPCH
jgi:hypothetical protein